VFCSVADLDVCLNDWCWEKIYPGAAHPSVGTVHPWHWMRLAAPCALEPGNRGSLNILEGMDFSFGTITEFLHGISTSSTSLTGGGPANPHCDECE